MNKNWFPIIGIASQSSLKV